MKILTGHEGRLKDLAFSPDGSLLASSGGDGALRVWDTTSGESFVLTQFTDRAIAFGFWAVAFTADGKNVIAQLKSGGFQVWDVGKRSCVADFLNRREDERYTVAVAVSPRGDLVATTDRERPGRAYVVRLRVTHNWKEVVLAPRVEGGPFVLCFDPTGKRLATSLGFFDVTARTWLTRETWLGDPLKWSPTGQFLAGSYRNTLLISDAQTGKEVQTLQLERKEVQDFAFSPDGAFLVAVSNEEVVRIWDVRNWTEREGFAWQIGQLKCVAFAPDGQRAACGSHDGTILIWDWDL
jgi:WD40 repeat protein